MMHKGPLPPPTPSPKAPGPLGLVQYLLLLLVLLFLPSLLLEHSNIERAAVDMLGCALLTSEGERETGGRVSDGGSE